MKNRLTKVLIIITIIVWGFIFYSIAEVIWFQKNDTPADSEKDFLNNSLTLDQKFSFEKLNSDPFALKVKKEVIPRNINTNLNPIMLKKQLKEEPIPFELTGIVLGGNKSIMIKDKVNNEVYFLKEKDMYKDHEILKVTKNRVLISNQNTLKIDTLFFR